MNTRDFTKKNRCALQRTRVVRRNWAKKNDGFLQEVSISCRVSVQKKNWAMKALDSLKNGYELQGVVLREIERQKTSITFVFFYEY